MKGFYNFNRIISEIVNNFKINIKYQEEYIMKKKVMICLLAALLVLTLGAGAIRVAASPVKNIDSSAKTNRIGGCVNICDFANYAGKNTICIGSRQHQQTRALDRSEKRSESQNNYIDKNGDGICDNRNKTASNRGNANCGRCRCANQ